MTCEYCSALIDDYVDGVLAAEDRSRIEAHLVECERCRALAADIRSIRDAARGLDPIPPPPHVWPRLAASLDAERARSYRRRSMSWRPLAAAALIVLAAGAAAWWIVQERTAAPPPTRAAVPSSAATGTNAELARSVETELKLAEEHYQKAILGLEQITRTESTALDPQVAAVLQKNLEVIDQAIGESRAALQTQPANEVAQESLFQALRNKVALLQDTVVLINEMRKGDPEGTARAVSGLNQ